MTLPVLTMRIAFTTNPYNDTPSWADVSSDLISVHTKRGRQHQLDRFEAGTAIVLLNNADGHYWPDNTGGNYYPNVTLGRRVNFRATYDSTTYDEFTGFIRKYRPVWLGDKGLLHPGMILEITDLQRNLSRCKVTSAGYAQELSGARVDNVLDDLGWNATERDIDTGKEIMIASGALANAVLMEHMFKVQESELSTFWIRGDGYVIYNERGSRTGSSLATFGDSELPIDKIEFSLDDDLLYNEIRLNREDGTEQSHIDATSIIDHGLRTLSRSGLFLISDIIVLALVFYLLSRYKDAAMRVKSITVKPQTPGYESTLWPFLLNSDIGDKITLTLSRAHIDGDYFIEGIEHDWDYRRGEWTTKLQLSSADQYYNELDPRQDILRPTADGDIIQNTPFGEATNWECVDDVTPDDDTTYVSGTGVDVFEVTDAPYPLGIINKIIVTIRVRKTEGGTRLARQVIRTNGTTYEPDLFEITSSYADYEWELTTNPNTSAAWTWVEIDALQAGAHIPTGGSRLTQVFVTVDYTPAW